MMRIENKFKKIYVCFSALKQGFLGGCRPIIGVDGCHLKGPHGGVLLTVVGVDPNNNLYPIAYAVVQRENRDTWEWFLTVLKQDLDISWDEEYTFMSDKQKGLIQAFLAVFPNSACRIYVRHLHNNFKNAGYRGLAFKNALWKAARSSTMGEFTLRMEEMRLLDQVVFDWFNDKPPQEWTKGCALWKDFTEQGFEEFVVDGISSQQTASQSEVVSMPVSASGVNVQPSISPPVTPQEEPNQEDDAATQILTQENLTIPGLYMTQQYVRGSSMYEQLHMGNLNIVVQPQTILHPRLNIRAPPP
ncbi:UNVERIFIED_CONTAM: hypothetical protein Sradi_5566800 [Sesamum radiatum]|uniref:MULE transposase domain-containing protein n=1 Tax=Sesamum radiatum TaxID=300843 RepID=A0AAW2LGN5_SESRA